MRKNNRVTITLDTRVVNKDGEYPIKAYIPSARMYIATGVCVKEDQWNDGKVVSSPRARMLNKFLEGFAVNLENCILRLKDSGDWEMLTKDKKALRRALNGQEWKNTDTFLDIARRFNDTHEKTRTKEIYEQTFRRMEAYTDMGRLSMEDITPEWLRSFSLWLGGSVNGRAVHLRNIRAVFNYAIDNEITTNYPFRKFKIRREETRKRSLTVDDVRMIRDIQLGWGHMDEYRDTFLLLIYLIGVNLADLWSPDSRIVHGRLEYKRQKTGRLYSIRIEREAAAILERIGYGKNHILASMDRYKDLHDYTRRLNEGLQRIGPIIGKGGNGSPKTRPLYPGLTSYWARHTWATLASELDIPKETISAALGHEIGSRITSIYIDYDMKKVDAANRKVIDYIKRGVSPDTPQSNN